MRMRSTGLGKTELEATIQDVKRLDDAVVFYVNTTKPVRWRVRMVFQEQDMRVLFKAIMKPKNLLFILRSLFSDDEKVKRTDSF